MGVQVGQLHSSQGDTFGRRLVHSRLLDRLTRYVRLGSSTVTPGQHPTMRPSRSSKASTIKESPTSETPPQSVSAFNDRWRLKTKTESSIEEADNRNLIMDVPPMPT